MWFGGWGTEGKVCEIHGRCKDPGLDVFADAGVVGFALDHVHALVLGDEEVEFLVWVLQRPNLVLVVNGISNSSQHLFQ